MITTILTQDTFISVLQRLQSKQYLDNTLKLEYNLINEVSLCLPRIKPCQISTPKSNR